MKLTHGNVRNDEIKLPWLLLGELVTWIGVSFVWPLTSVYLNKQLHVSLSVIGLVFFCNCATNILGSMLAGRLYDKMNPYPLIVGGEVCDMVLLFVMAAFHGWPAYWVWLSLLGFIGGWNGTIINSIATSIKRYPGRYVFNMIYFVQNLGVVIGTLAVGYLYDISVTLLFIVAGSLFIVAVVNAVFKYRPIINFHRERQAQQKRDRRVKAEAMTRPNFVLSMGLFVSLAVIWLMYMNWESNLPVYMVSLGIPFHLYSLLWTLNAGIIVVVQALLARFPDIFHKMIHQVLFGVVMFSLSYVTLIFAKDFLHFALSMVILTLGEATANPAIPAYVNELTPLTAKGKYQGLTMVASGVGRAFGPLFGGLIIDHAGYVPFFVVAAAGIGVLLLVLLPLYRSLHKKLTLYK